MTGEDAKMNCRIIEGADQINTDEVVELLRTTYWANKRSKEQIRKSMDNSVCYGVYLDDEQKLIGFARVISDFATTYYLADVIIDPDYQHRGLGKMLVSYIETGLTKRTLRNHAWRRRALFDLIYLCAAFSVNLRISRR